MKKSCILMMAFMVFASALFFLSCQTKEVTSAKVYIQQDDWPKAIEQLEQAVKLTPNDMEAHFLLGQGYSMRSRWIEMNREFDASLAVGPKFEQQINSIREKAWVDVFNSGVKKINSGDVNGAIENFNTCLVINPKRSEAYQNLAFAYTKNSDTDNAIASYKNWLEMEPKNTNAMKALGGIYFDNKSYDLALEMYTLAMEVSPDDVDPIANIAMIYDNQGDADKAMEYYQKALAKRPDDLDLVFNLGRYYYMKGEYAKAIEEFSKVNEKNPEDFDATVNIGNAYLSIGQHLYKELKQLEDEGKPLPDDKMAEMKENFNKSVKFLEKAVELKDDNSTAWYNLGVAYINVGESEKGKVAFDKAESLK